MTTSLAKPHLALIHGWGLGRAAWQPVTNRLSAYYTLHVVDLPGYGEAPADSRSFAEIARRIVDGLPVGTTLCGWSLGAMLALEAAHQCPERVSALVLVGATPSFVKRQDWPHGQATTMLGLFTAAVRNNPRDTLQRFIALLNQGDTQARANTRTQQQSLPTDALPDSDSLLQGLDWLRKSELRPLIPAVSIPTLLIHGEHDPLMPLAAAEWLAEHLPEAQLEVFKGAAHAPFLSDPERFADLLIDTCYALPNHQATRS